jgi:thiamine pyrophosphokinase
MTGDLRIRLEGDFDSLTENQKSELKQRVKNIMIKA